MTPQPFETTVSLSLNSDTQQQADLQAGGLIPGEGENRYWVINQTSGARLSVIFYPQSWDGVNALPTLILMPGGIGKSDTSTASRLSEQGFLIIIFDADGRIRSEGEENYNGFVTQDGLASVILASMSLSGLDQEQFDLVSYSYGITAASGTLARYPGLPIDFLIDWEGPIDRNYTTGGCAEVFHGIEWQPCTNDEWWSEREAVNFIGELDIPYQRIQTQTDHVQPTNDHAIEIVNAAILAGVPWVRLNNYPPNQIFDLTNPPLMIPDEQDKQMIMLVANYSRNILDNVLSGKQ